MPEHENKFLPSCTFVSSIWWHHSQLGFQVQI
jgi:hypothetical protein